MKRTKSRQLMQIAYATYRRNEPEIAKDIFVLAMEDASAASEFGTGSREEQLQRLREAVASGDYEEAAEQLDAMEETWGEDDEIDFVPDDSIVDDEDDEEDTEAYETSQPLPQPELAPAQVASLVTLARRIRQEGHPDLANRITRALGL